MKVIAAMMAQDLKRGIPVVAAAVIFLSLLSISYGTTCSLTLLSGYPCPACGMTRASLLFARGRVIQSFLMHPAFLLVLSGVLLEGYWRYWLEKPFPYRKKYIILVIAIGLILYWYRMVHWFPDREPMTYRQENLLVYLLRLVEAIR